MNLSTDSSFEQETNNQLTSQDSTQLLFSRVLLIKWETENTYCYQVEENSICVARRRDNNMINGTKLLNVALMTRGKRDAILKNETSRQVVKSGSMILKGVWIPFERAIVLAKEHNVYNMLYPLFEVDIQNIYADSLATRRSSFAFGTSYDRIPLHLQHSSINNNQNIPSQRPTRSNSYDFRMNYSSQFHPYPIQSHNFQYYPVMPNSIKRKFSHPDPSAIFPGFFPYNLPDYVDILNSYQVGLPLDTSFGYPSLYTDLSLFPASSMFDSASLSPSDTDFLANSTNSTPFRQ